MVTNLSINVCVYNLCFKIRFVGVINFISLNVSASFAKMMIYYLDNLYISKGL